MIIALRTDQPEAEIHLCDAQGLELEERHWLADRKLTATLLETIQSLLEKHSATWHALTGVIIYQGPGSFTGLRIGAAVANALADSRQIPVIASQGDQWLADGVGRLLNGDNDKIALPEYGATANVTMPSR